MTSHVTQEWREPLEHELASVEKQLERLYAEMREFAKHPSFPWVDKIPGYRFNGEEIDRLEDRWAEIKCALAEDLPL